MLLTKEYLINNLIGASKALKVIRYIPQKIIIQVLKISSITFTKCFINDDLLKYLDFKFGKIGEKKFHLG